MRFYCCQVYMTIENLSKLSTVHIILKSKRLIKKLEKMSFRAVFPLSLGSNLP